MAYSWERTTEEEKAAILASLAGAPVRQPPRVVEISWQDRCNIDCFFCSTSEIRAGNFELSGERLEKLFDEMRAMGVRGVRLMGGGEPLFRKDAAALIAAIGARGLRITDVTTNGVLLTEPVVRALYAAGCDEICVSLNTGDARSYAAMMQTTRRNFDRVVENMRRAAALKRETGSATQLRVQFLVYRENYRQLPEMYRLFRETGADRFWLNGLYPVRPMPTMSDADVAEMLRRLRGGPRPGLLRAPRALLVLGEVDRRAHRGLDAEGVRAGAARAPGAREAQARPRPRGRAETRALAPLHEFCLVGWYSMTLNANGDAVTCCILQDHPTAVLGSIHSSSLAEIWFGAAYSRFRAELSEIMARRGEVADFSSGLLRRRASAPRRAPARPAPTTGRATPTSAGSSTTSSRPCPAPPVARSPRCPPDGPPRACQSTPASTNRHEQCSRREAPTTGFRRQPAGIRSRRE